MKTAPSKPFRQRLLSPSVRLYYRIKPLLPRPLQIALRRTHVKFKRRSVRHVWPIEERAARPPAGWPGWPDGKTFAVVLTHDVEQAVGLDKCRAVMAMETAAGVRSSFNFVPARYAVPPELRQALIAGGFEVGVHGYLHDGLLFSSQAVFRKRAAKINRILLEWGATGFRAPSVHHNLEWQGELNITYDSSTFDTDPFEPHADGVHTIFPFHVSRGAASPPYVELPYTLPQDFTLYVLMREQTPRLWKQKLDWIARRGGMALINTHPDYMSVDGKPCRNEEYPVALYTDFLTYIKAQYGDQCWYALPREVADYCSRLPLLEPPPPRQRVCMLSYSFYEMDNRVIRYAETLAANGAHVDVVALRCNEAPREEVLNGVHIHRIQNRARNESGKFQYLFRLLKFLFLSSFWVSRESLRERFDVVHIHSVPDFEVFAAWLPKWLGSRIILDIHDLVPEFYAAKFHVDSQSLIFRMLLNMERWSAAFADHLIAANHLWHDTLVSRAVPPEKCTAIPNYVDLNVFSRQPRQPRDRDGFRIVYAGGIQEHQGLDVVIRAMARLRNDIAGLEFHIHGSGTQLTPLITLTHDLDLEGIVLFKDNVPFHAVPQLLAQADLGVVAKRAEGFADEAFSTKILEFMSQAVPVVASRTKIDTYYYAEDEVRFFESGNDQALAEAILSLYRDENTRHTLAQAGYRCALRNSWAANQSIYLRLLEKPVLTGSGPQEQEPVALRTATMNERSAI